MIKPYHVALCAFVLFLGVLCGGSGFALADSPEDWRIHKDPNILYQCRIPKNYDFKPSQIAVADGIAATYDVLNAQITSDEDPHDIREYTVRFVQTLGLPFTVQRAERVINTFLQEQIDSLPDPNPIERDRDIYRTKDGFFGGEIHLSYQDPELGERSLRARVRLSQVTKFEQIAITPDKKSHSLRNTNFIKQARFSGEYKTDTGNIKDSWTRHISPLGLFSVYLPSAPSSFAPYKPKITSTDDTESIKFRFYDPVYKQFMAYNIRGYKFGTTLTQKAVEEVLLKKWKRHTHKFTSGDATIDENGYNFMQAELHLKPNSKSPYIDYGKLYIYFKDGNMVIHEVLGPTYLVRGTFPDTLLEHAEFLPEPEETITAP